MCFMCCIVKISIIYDKTLGCPAYVICVLGLSMMKL